MIIIIIAGGLDNTSPLITYKHAYVHIFCYYFLSSKVKNKKYLLRGLSKFKSRFNCIALGTARSVSSAND